MQFPVNSFRVQVSTPREPLIGVLISSFFLFVVVSRLPEVLANSLGTSLKIAVVLSLLAGILSVICGNLLSVLRTSGSIAFIAFTGWWIFCIPFSVWPGGSFALLHGKWVFSLMIFYVVAAMPMSSRGLNLYAGAMAWSAVFVNLVLLRYGVDDNARGSLEFASSLSNPNIAALQLLLGLPFLIYWVRTRGVFTTRGLAGLSAAALLAALIVTKTGSRSGLLILAAMILMIIAGTKLSVRMMLFFTLLIGSLAVIPFIPSYLIYRYGTMFATAANDNSEAAASTRERKEVLRESLVLTLKHPLTGVGPGQFRVAEAAISKDEGVRALWLETHNMYTEISSETGLPGIVFYLSMIFLSLGPVWKDFRSASRARSLLPRHEFARAVLISAFGILINSVFTSIAYDYYWPVMCALGIACQRIASMENAADVNAAPAAGRAQSPLRLAPRPA
jgi:O-antigen ligase